MANLVCPLAAARTRDPLKKQDGFQIQLLGNPHLTSFPN
jgi:hypothetical protein